MPQHPETARIEDLLAHADWLRRLAAGLVGDGDDVVQETWAAALRSPPRTDRPTQPWLAGVLRNLVRNQWRAGKVRRRAAPDLAAEQQETAASPEDLLERAQLQRVLGELVLELEEPYRSAVLLRYYEGQNSAEIAARLQVPAGTVRWRLKEGIERLRRGLDARHGGDRARWLPLLVPLAAPAPGGGSAAVPRSFPAEGTVLMAMSVSTKSKLVILAALALLVIGGGAWWRWGGTGSGTGSSGAEMAARARALRPLSPQETALPPASIEGEVRDPERRPVAGAVVVLSRATADWRAGALPAGLAVSDQDGRFRFDDARPGEHLVSASAPGFAATLSPPFELQARERKRLSLIVQRGGVELQGRVLDEGGGPIPGARVTARITLSGGTLTPGPAKLLQALADGDGRYRLALSPREYTVRAEANGYAPLETTVALTRPLTQDLRLHPAARVSGRIVERAGGTAVAGAEVQINPTNMRESGDPRATRTDEEGRFAFDDLSAGRYQISARRGTLLGTGPVLDLVATDGVDGVVVALDRGVSVSGRLTGDGGRGVAGGQVTLAAITTISGRDGSFRVEGVPPGPHRLRVAASREGWKSAEKALTVGPGGLDGVEVALARGAVLTGRVLAPDGTPAAGIYVRATPEDGRSFGPFAAETAIDGTFRIAGLPDGTATVLAWDPVRGVAQKEGAGPFSVDGRGPVELRLAPAGSISGLVVFDDGTPAAAVSVAFTGQSRGGTYTSVSTGDDGRFSVSGLLPGRYTVKARRKSGPWNLSTSVERPDLRLVTVGADSRTDGVQLVLRKGGKSIAGKALLADGQPAVGTLVVANVEENGRSWRPQGQMIEHSGMVREDGRFTIEDVEDGAFTLWAIRPGFPEAEVNHVAAGRQDVEVKLAAPASVSGVVTDKSGRPLPAFSLNVVPGVPAGAETPEQRLRRMDGAGFSYRPMHDPAGRFEWRGLRAGNYEVKVNTPEGAAAMQPVTLQAGEHKQGLRIAVDSGVRVTGKAVDLESGAPLAQLRVYARTAGRHLDTTTNGEGLFELVGLVPGEEVEVRVIAADGYVPETKHLAVPAGATTADLGLFRLLPGDMMRSREATGTFRMALQSREEKVNVLLVREGSSADKAGLKVGDRILKVEGRDVQGLGAGAIHYLLTRNAGASATLTVQSPGGEPRTLTMAAEPHNRPTPAPAPPPGVPRQN